MLGKITIVNFCCSGRFGPIVTTAITIKMWIQMWQPNSKTPNPFLNIADIANIEGYSFPTIDTSRLCHLEYGWHNYSSFLFSRSDAIPSLNLLRITRIWIPYLHFFLKRKTADRTCIYAKMTNEYIPTTCCLIGVDRGAASGSSPPDLPARPGHVSYAKPLTLASRESPQNVPAAGTGEKCLSFSVLSPLMRSHH